jgi:hypothetical protein
MAKTRQATDARAGKLACILIIVRSPIVARVRSGPRPRDLFYTIAGGFSSPSVRARPAARERRDGIDRGGGNFDDAGGGRVLYSGGGLREGRDSENENENDNENEIENEKESKHEYEDA